jgi:hypothetical protein
MDDQLRGHVETLEQHVQRLTQQTDSVGCRLRWWCRFACSLTLLTVFGLPLSLNASSDDRQDHDRKGATHRWHGNSKHDDKHPKKNDDVAGTTTRVSVDSAGNEGNSLSFASSISANGRFVAFSSFASNLVPGDSNGQEDIFVHELAPKPFTHDRDGDDDDDNDHDDDVPTDLSHNRFLLDLLERIQRSVR